MFNMFKTSLSLFDGLRLRANGVVEENQQTQFDAHIPLATHTVDTQVYNLQYTKSLPWKIDEHGPVSSLDFAYSIDGSPVGFSIHGGNGATGWVIQCVS